MYFLNSFGKPKPLDDATLIENYKKFDDKLALEELFQRYNHLVYSVCRKYLKNREESQDAVMDIFAKLVGDLKSHEISNFKSWLYIVAKNYCRMKMRQSRPEASALQKYSEIEHLTEENSELEILNRIDERTLGHELHLALEQLDEPQRTCIQLFYFEEKSYREITEITKFETKQVKSYIQNGKRNLQRILLHRKALIDVE